MVCARSPHFEGKLKEKKKRRKKKDCRVPTAERLHPCSDRPQVSKIDKLSLNNHQICPPSSAEQEKTRLSSGVSEWQFWVMLEFKERLL